MKFINLVGVAAILCSTAYAYAEEPHAAPTANATGESGDNFGGYGKPKGLLGPITLGPQLTLVGLPTLVRFGVEAKLANLLGFGLEYGFTPGVSLGTVNINLNTFQASFKIYPFRGAFYLGASMGTQNFSGTIPTTIAGTTVTMTGTASTFYITPTLGWKWVWNSGFFTGMDFGWQVAMNSSSTVTSSPSSFAAAAAGTTEMTSLNNTLLSIGKASLPSMSLIQIGYLF